MQELIKISVSAKNNQVVNARDLHDGLKSKKDFSSWIKNKVVNNPIFIENEDYAIIPQIGENSKRVGRPTIDYALTLNTAKQVALMENTDKGREIRQYFIDAEEKFRDQTLSNFQIPQTFGEALKLAAEQQFKIEAQQKELKENAPKVELHDALMASDKSIDFGTFAKNLGYGRNTLYKMLREDSILMKSNTPYQAYMKYFEVKEVVKGRNLYNKTLVNPQGQKYLLKKYGK